MTDAGFEVLSRPGLEARDIFGKVSKSEQIASRCTMHDYEKIWRGVRDHGRSDILHEMSNFRALGLAECLGEFVPNVAISLLA